MPDENRRTEDERLARLESAVNKLYAKVTNGITERGIRTEKMVEDLMETHQEFENRFRQHIVQEEIESNNTSHNINAMTKAITHQSAVMDNQSTAIDSFIKGWNTTKNRSIIAVIAALLSFIGFVFMHLPEINALMAHVMDIN